MGTRKVSTILAEVRRAFSSLIYMRELSMQILLDLTYTWTVDQASFLLEKGGSWDGEKAKKDGGIARGEKPLAFLFPVLARVRW